MMAKVHASLQALYDDLRGRIIKLAATSTHDGDFLYPVFGEGNTDAGLLLLGEAPGADEAAAGRPFVGKAGKQLDELLLCAGISREEIYISNIVKYRPVKRSERSLRNRTPTRQEVELFFPDIGQELRLLDPQIIATLGNTPLQAILKIAGEEPQTIGTCHGHPRTILIAGRQYTLFPLYHPASGIYNCSLIDVMLADARLLGEQLVKR